MFDFMQSQFIYWVYSLLQSMVAYFNLSMLAVVDYISYLFNSVAILNLLNFSVEIMNI